MTARYISFHSQFRNRTVWPNPAEFEVINSAGKNSISNAIDPVSLSFPLHSWTSNSFNRVENKKHIRVSTVLFDASSRRIIFAKSLKPNTFQTDDNYYRRAILKNKDHYSKTVRISESKFLGNDITQFVLESDLVLTQVNEEFLIVDPSDVVSSLLFVPNGSSRSDCYSTALIYNETLNQFRQVKWYDNETALLLIDSTIPVESWKNNHNFSIRKSPPAFVCLAGNSTPDKIVLDEGIKQISETLNGWYIRIPKTKYSINNEYFSRIVNFQPSTLIASVSPPFDFNPTGQIIELLQVNYDNATPLMVKGISPQETYVSRVRLIKLTLPNVNLIDGGKTSNLPFVFVEITNSEIPLSNIISSNNPNANKAVFTASIPNCVNRFSDFIDLVGDNITQTITFKIGTAQKIKLTLPNGNLFSPICKDNFSPSLPNEMVQIRCLLEIV